MPVNVRSVNQILADMIRTVLAETSLTDVTPGSVLATILESAALSDYQNNVSILKILESTRLESLVGTDLDNKAIEIQLPNGIGGVGRIPANRASGIVTVGSAFTKKSTTFYLGKPAPFSGATTLYVLDATGWPLTGQLYIARNTPTEEGPIAYTALVNNGNYWTITLNPSTPILKAHKYDDSLVLSQGGLRIITVGTKIVAPATDNSPQVIFSTDSSLTLLDGEDKGDVKVTCDTFGEAGNVVAGNIKTFTSSPFVGATVTNGLAFANGSPAENDEDLRQRIKNYPATLSKGTTTAILANLQNLKDPVSGKTINSVNIVEPITNTEPARAFVDDGTGLEPSIEGQSFESLISDASGQEVLFRTAFAPVTPCLTIGTTSAPFKLIENDTLSVTLDGITETFRVNSADYVNLNSVATSEIVNAFNSQGNKIAFRTANNGTQLEVFDVTGQGEQLLITAGNLQNLLGLSTLTIRPIYLFQNSKLLTFKGQTATLTTQPFPWNSQSSMTSVQVKVDGILQTFSVSNSDFVDFGTQISTATLDQWATVLRTKIAGVKITPTQISAGSSVLVWSTWQSNSVSGSLEIITSNDWVADGKMWSTSQVLNSTGANIDFEFNRLSGQIGLLNKPNAGDSITLASDKTQATIFSATSTSGVYSLGITTLGNPKLIMAFDGDFLIKVLNIPASSTFVASATTSPNVVRLTASSSSVVSNMEATDFIYLARDSSLINPVPANAENFYRIKQKSTNWINITCSQTEAALLISQGTIDINNAVLFNFQCQNSIPQIIDLGATPTLTVDGLVSVINGQLQGGKAVKVSPRQLIIKSNNFDQNTTVAIFATIGTAKNIFSAQIATSIQPHIASAKTGYFASGFAKVQGVSAATLPADYYANRNYLQIKTTQTNILDQANNPAIESTEVAYPIGLEELFITGRNTSLLSRVYNESSIAPFAGIVRGKNTFKPREQSSIPSDITYDNVSLRLEDIPLNFTDKLVVQLNNDAVNNSYAIPFAKLVNIYDLDPVAGGVKGSQVKFTLSDPEDSNLQFFDITSPYKDFDFSDFNLLFHPTCLHSFYEENNLTKLPDFSTKHVLMIQSTQYGSAHRIKFSVNYPTVTSAATLGFAHKNYEENGSPVLHFYVTLTSGNLVGSFNSIYTLTFSNYAGNGGSALVQINLNATGINPALAQFKVGDILVIGGSGTYAGSYLITATPDADNVQVVAPGIHMASYSPVVYDAAQNPLFSMSKGTKTLADIVTGINNYYPNNPILTAKLITNSNTVKALYPTYFTGGNTVVNNNLTTMSDSIDYHSAYGYFGNTVNVFLYRRLDDTLVTVNEARAISQYDDPPVITTLDKTGTTYTYRGEECCLIPANLSALERWFNFTAISSISTQANINRVNTDKNLQINSLQAGSAGAVYIKGITAQSLTSILKNTPSTDNESTVRAPISYAQAQAMPRGSLIELTNDIALPIGRAYTHIPSALPGFSAITTANTPDTKTFFRDTTKIFYAKQGDIARFFVQRSASGFVAGNSSIQITKINSYIARVSVPLLSTNTLNARVGDMLVINNASAALTANKCINLTSAITYDQYIGYPVVHVASLTEIYVIGTNLVNDTFTLTDETDVCFVPHVRNEKNIQTNYKSSAKYTELVTPGEQLYCRIKPIGYGFVFANFSTTSFINNLDMGLSGLSVSTDDFISFSAAFNIRNQGKFRIVAHNGTDTIIFFNEAAVEEITELVTGNFEWNKLPFSEASRSVRIWDVNSVFAGDRLNLASPAITTSNWFSTAVLGSRPVNNIGLSSRLDLVIAVDMANAPLEATSYRNVSEAIFLGNGTTVNYRLDNAAGIQVGDLVSLRDFPAPFDEHNFDVSLVPGDFIPSVISSVDLLNNIVTVDHTDRTFTNADNYGITSGKLYIPVTLGASASAVSFLEPELTPGDTRTFSYKWVTGYAASNANQDDAELFLAPASSFEKMLPENGTNLNVLYKMAFPANNIEGVDAYKYYTELIYQAHKVIDGSPTNSIDFPGVRAAGSVIEITAPLIKSIKLSLSLIPTDGVSISSIKAPVRSVISTYINGLGVGREVILSEIIRRVQQVPGIKSVTIDTISPAATNGIIATGSFEVPRILDSADISI